MELMLKCIVASGVIFAALLLLLFVMMAVILAKNAKLIELNKELRMEIRFLIDSINSQGFNVKVECIVRSLIFHGIAFPDGSNHRGCIGLNNELWEFLTTVYGGRVKGNKILFNEKLGVDLKPIKNNHNEERIEYIEKNKKGIVINHTFNLQPHELEEKLAGIIYPDMLRRLDRDGELAHKRFDRIFLKCVNHYRELEPDASLEYKSGAMVSIVPYEPPSPDNI